MPPKRQPVLTFQQVRAQCEQGDPEAWRAFLDLYAPLCFHLIGIYSPDPPEAATSAMPRLLAALSENDCARLGDTARESEREFLGDIRALLLDALLENGGKPAESPEQHSSAHLSLETLAKLLEGLPLTHQEMLFFRLCGYTDASLEPMLRIAPRVAQAAFARLDPDHAAAAHPQQDRCPWPRTWLSVLRKARAAKRDDCPSLHQFLRIHDGQVSWYDKEPAEKHVTGCLYCLERWTALREVGYWRRKARPIPPVQAKLLVEALPVAAPSGKSLLQRWFG